MAEYFCSPPFFLIGPQVQRIGLIILFMAHYPHGSVQGPTFFFLPLFVSVLGVMSSTLSIFHLIPSEEQL